MLIVRLFFIILSLEPKTNKLLIDENALFNWNLYSNLHTLRLPSTHLLKRELFVSIVPHRTSSLQIFDCLLNLFHLVITLIFITDDTLLRRNALWIFFLSSIERRMSGQTPSRFLLIKQFVEFHVNWKRRTSCFFKPYRIFFVFIPLLIFFVSFIVESTVFGVLWATMLLQCSFWEWRSCMFFENKEYKKCLPYAERVILYLEPKDIVGAEKTDRTNKKHAAREDWRQCEMQIQLLHL